MEVEQLTFPDLVAFRPASAPSHAPQDASASIIVAYISYLGLLECEPSEHRLQLL
jgi:hypothetical protein